MKFFGKKRYVNGDKKYFFFGLPFLVKKKTNTYIKIYFLGIRVFKRDLHNHLLASGSPNPLTVKQLARVRYIRRVNRFRFVNERLCDKSRKISILVQAHAIQHAYERGLGIFAIGLLKAMDATGKIEIDFLYDRAAPLIHDKCDFCKLHPVVTLKQLDSDDEKVYDFYFDPHLYSGYFKNNICSAQRMSCAKHYVGILHDILPSLNYGTYSDFYTHDTAESNLSNVYLADHIFANSKCTANDAMNALDIPKEGITVIYGGVDTSRYDNTGNVKSNNDLVAILGSELRKNIIGAIVAFVKAYESGKLPEDARIIIASCWEKCCMFRYDEAVAQIKNALKITAPSFLDENMFNKRIVMFSKYRPTDKEVGEMIRACRATIFPSFCEGLGLPILESYALGKACIASNVSSMEEITHPECQFDPFDNDSIAEKIIEIYNDPKLCEKSIAFGNKLLAEQCNWDVAAAKVISKLEEMLKPKEI